MLKAFGARVILNYSNEANLKSENRGTPAQFRAAFNHIVGVFRAAGVTNVSYALDVTNTAFIKGQADNWYPGDSTVDVISHRPDTTGPACPDNPFTESRVAERAGRPFQSAFAAAYAYTVKHGKAMIIAETGSAEDPYHPGRKAQWILDMAHTAKSWPSLRGIIWFNAGKRLSYWNIDSSQSALNAYVCVGHDPAFGGTGPSCPGT